MFHNNGYTSKLFNLTTLINPTTHLNNSEKQLLISLFNQHDIPVFIAHHPYEIITKQKSNEPIKRKIILTNRIIVRNCRPDGKHKNDIRFEVISNHLIGQGSFSSVFPIEATIVPIVNPASTKNIQNILIKKTTSTGNTRVVKIVKIKNPDSSNESTNNFKNRIEREINLSSPLLHLKSPIFDNDTHISYLVMRQFNNVHLFSKIRDYNTDQRLDIALALLKAGKEQIQDRKVIHRDLKADNILRYYDTTSRQWVVIIIDYGLAKEHDKLDENEPKGNLLNMSPEAYRGCNSTYQRDVYALGCLLNGLLGGTRHKELKSESELKEEYVSGIRINNLFKDMPELDETLRTLLLNLIRHMTIKSPQERATLDQAIDSLEKIILTYRTYDLSEINKNTQSFPLKIS